jgi:hypothetical protein
MLILIKVSFSILKMQTNFHIVKKDILRIAFRQAIRSNQFILLFAMNFFSLCKYTFDNKSVVYGYFLINAFKLYGLRNNFTDSFLTLVGAVGALFNCVGRFLGAWLMDYF